MKLQHEPTRTGVASRKTWPRRTLAATAALMLAVPGAAYPISLSQLMRLPLKELLRLDISGPVSTPRLRAGAPAALPLSAERRTP